MRGKDGSKRNGQVGATWEYLRKERPAIIHDASTILYEQDFADSRAASVLPDDA